MLPEITADRVERLAAELQREADRNEYAMLLIVKRRPLGEYAASPYGVPEAWADQWEKANYERRVVPAGRGDGKG